MCSVTISIAVSPSTNCRWLEISSLGLLALMRAVLRELAVHVP